MVQLQSDLEKFKTANIQIIGISYDEVDVLKTFSEKKNITFPLLSDEGSKIIRSVNLENKGGLPHPGTLVVDTSGVVRGKLFNEGYKKRHGNQSLIDLVEQLELSGGPATNSE